MLKFITYLDLLRVTYKVMHVSKGFKNVHTHWIDIDFTNKDYFYKKVMSWLPVSFPLLMTAGSEQCAVSDDNARYQPRSYFFISGVTYSCYN